METPKNIIIKMLMIDIIIIIRKWSIIVLWLWLCLLLCLCRSGNVKPSAHSHNHNDICSFIVFWPMSVLVPVTCRSCYSNMASNFDERLASLVESFPILYHKSLTDFKDRNKKKNAWNEVAEKMDLETGTYWTYIFLRQRETSTVVSLT